MLSAILVFVIILILLIFVHELGHFLTVRKFGIKAQEFGFGFPPRIFGIQFLQDGKKYKIWKFSFPKTFRIIWGSKDGDDENEKKDLEEAHKKKVRGGTIYSLNWIFLGGFVKIKGEDGGDKKDPDSFASKPAGKRILVLAAGVIMNFIFAWVLITFVFMLGAPQSVELDGEKKIDAKIQISGVSSNSPAEIAGFKIGDEILKVQKNLSGKEVKLESIEEVQDYVDVNRGQKIDLKIRRGQEDLKISVTPRISVPENQGPLGISLAQTVIVKYPWYKSIWEGLKTTLALIGAILFALFEIIRNLFLGQGVGAEVAGPVGIAVLTREVSNLGLVYILQFAALLSINLGIVNILPIPALDGGRILFVLIEKIKGKPISQKIEQAFHSTGFLLLVLLLALITFKDVFKYIK